MKISDKIEFPTIGERIILYTGSQSKIAHMKQIDVFHTALTFEMLHRVVRHVAQRHFHREKYIEQP
jgi:hypothetical protein